MLGIGKVHMKENVTYKVTDKNGKTKQVFQENALWRVFKRLLGLDIQIPYLTGTWSDKKLVSNLVVTAGKAGVTARLLWDTSGHEAPFTYIALGTGTTAADAANTTLETESAATGLARAAGTLSQEDTTTTDDTAQLIKTFTNGSGGAVAVTESGVLNAASTGTLLARQVFAAINLQDGDSVQITWQFPVTTA